jgi:O-acetylserine/cysteine efflux transporter
VKRARKAATAWSLRPDRTVPTRLPARHALLALAVVAVWGTNFVVIRVALDTFTPLWLAVLRFALTFAPAALFIKRPDVPWRKLAAYGALIGAGQFALLYLAITRHIAPGLASLVVQMQVFFTIGLAGAIDGERVRPLQWLALAVAALGIAVIGANVRSDAQTSLLGVVMVLGAGAAWAAGNQVQRSMGRVHALGVVVWSSLFALPLLIPLALAFEGPAALPAALSAAPPGALAAVLWQAVGNSLFGYAAWAWLLARHPAATITPMALLVPVFGLGASALLLGEPLPPWKWIAAALVIGGLALNLVAARSARAAAAAAP